MGYTTHAAPAVALTPFEELWRQVDEIFEQALAASPVGHPGAEISDTDDAWLVRIAVEGARRRDLAVETRERVLWVSGELRPRWWDRIRRRARRQRSFELRFELPEAALTEMITAHLRRGVLTIRVPKAASARRRRIPIAA